MVLVALNALLWLAIVLTGGSSSRLFEWLALSPRGSCATGGGQYFPAAVQGTCGSGPFVPGSWMPGVVDGAYWQLLSSMFVHVGIGHLVLNCLAIYILGPQLEHVLGRWRFLALYLLSGLAGSALVYWAGPEIGGTHGASGAVFGLMAAWVVLALKRRQDYQGLLLWVGISFVYTFVMPNVSWQGHLGGFLGGLATAAVLLLAPRQRRAVVQAVGLGVVAVLVAAAIALRSLALA
jgi:membrane associated rhomboid family serine protease